MANAADSASAMLAHVPAGGNVRPAPWGRAEGKVGRADARLAEARDLVRVAVEQLRREPLAFLCRPGERCEECDAARASVGACLGQAGWRRPRPSSPGARRA